MIKKIKTIKNLGVFKNFEWDKAVLDKQNKVVDFKKINIIYARNYAGKTTISRILRSFETHVLPAKCEQATFELELDNRSSISNEYLGDFPQEIRVFNEDFVRENLRFIVDEDHGVKSFAVIGSQNARIEQKIEEIEKELGAEESQNCLYATRKNHQKTFNEAKTNFENVERELNNLLTNKARVIKENAQLFTDVNYDIRKIRSDIATVQAESYEPLNQEQIQHYHAILKEEKKDETPSLKPLNLVYDSLCNQTKECLAKELKPSNSIQSLLEDINLQEWVRNGRALHEDKRSECGFCGGKLDGLWQKLDAHFNQESEQLRNQLESLKSAIESEKKKIKSFLNINEDSFYSEYKQEFKDALEAYDEQIGLYEKALINLTEQVEKRYRSIFESFSFDAPQFSHKNLTRAYSKIETIQTKSNAYTSQLEPKQTKARNALRLNEVKTFVDTINYIEKCNTINSLKVTSQEHEKRFQEIKNTVKSKEVELNSLKASLNDEGAGAKRVNELLEHSFGSSFLTLQPIKEDNESKNSTNKVIRFEVNMGPVPELPSYRFEVTRNGEKAFSLSEGEKSILAFCYFVAKLDDINTKDKKPIIWIDDPISSLDNNHIYFVYSLIRSEIVCSHKFNQLFISTHNLEFLKLLKRLPGKINNKIDYQKEYFIILRNNKISNISSMPNYIKEYVTEFHYLFHQIYKCSVATSINDDNYSCFYGIGNNIRKFLEMLLFYRYPHRGMTEETLRLFFGDQNIPAFLTDRLDNELSHSWIERTSVPNDTQEMQKVAAQIVNQMRLDSDQFNDLLNSIGIENEHVSTESISLLETVKT